MGQLFKQVDVFEQIVREIGETFRCFGGGTVTDAANPIAHAVKDRPLQFALGVDVEEVVLFVLDRVERHSRAQLLRRVLAALVLDDLAAAKRSYGPGKAWVARWRKEQPEYAALIERACNVVKAAGGPDIMKTIG